MIVNAASLRPGVCFSDVISKGCMCDKILKMSGVDLFLLFSCKE